MAFYMERTGDPMGEEARRNKPPKNHTLEDVAEEMLNGMFCHYEPPDPQRVNAAPSILRTSDSKQQPQQPNRNVRWSDGVATERHPAMEIHCNMASHCVDAAVEGGCMSPKKKPMAQEFLAKYDYDLHQTHSNLSDASSSVVVGILKKNKQKSKNNKSIAYDDHGNLMSTNNRAGIPLPPPPPPPPAPSKNEKFIPELCGVSINCVDDDEQMELLSKASSEAPQGKLYRSRPAAQYTTDYEDGSNSLVSEQEQDDNGDDIDNDDSLVYRPQSQYRERPPIVVPAPSKTRSKSPMRRFLGGNSRAATANNSKSSSSKQDDWETSSTTSSLFRRVWPSRNRSSKVSDYEVEFSDDMDPVELVRSDSKSKRKAKKNKNKKMTNSDWDESLPIVPQAASTSRFSSRGRSKSPSRRRSSASRNEGRDASPGPMRRARSRSRSQDGKSRGRSKSPLKSALKGSTAPPTVRFNPDDATQPPSYNAGNDAQQMRLQMQQMQLQMQQMQQQQQQPLPPVSTSRPPMRPGQPPMAPGHPQMHPAHPLSRPELRDDAMERQSFITAHRDGFNPTQASVADDAMERQSFITAHRHGFDGSVAGGGPSSSFQPMMNDQMDRQSYITDHRQSFDGYSSKGRRGRSRSPRKGRGRSPYRRSQSFEQQDGDSKPGLFRSRGRSKERAMQQDSRRMSDPMAYQQAMAQQQSIMSVPSRGFDKQPAESVLQQSAETVQFRGQAAPVEPVPPTEEERLEEERLKAEAEMSWEEKTRIAWERLRGGVTESITSALAFDAPPEAPAVVQSPSHPGILKQPSSDKKVTFGQDEIRLHPSRDELFQAEQEQNENQPVSMKIYPAKQEAKKKKVFRGRKIISGLLGGKGKKNKNLSQSRSLDMTLTASSTASQEWNDQRAMQPMQQANYGGQQLNYGMNPAMQQNNYAMNGMPNGQNDGHLAA